MTKPERYAELVLSQDLDEVGHDSRGNLDMAFQSPLNWDADHFRQKLSLFSPYFMQMAATIPGPRVAELLSGNGTFLDMAAADLPGCDTAYVSWTRNSTLLFRHLYGEAPRHRLIEGRPAPGQIDVALCDATLNQMSEAQVSAFVEAAPAALSRGGLLCLLVDLTPGRVLPHLDLRAVHRRLEAEGLTCVHGMYTFSTLWVRG